MQNSANNTGIDMFKLVEFLQTFLPIVDSHIPTKINAGGCGIMARTIHKNLVNMGVDCKIVFIGENSQKEDMDYLLSNNSFKNRVGVDHCLIAISDYIYIDSMGVEKNPNLMTDYGDDTYVKELPLDILDTLIDNKDSWNIIFDRDCVPQIEKELGDMAHQFELFQQGKFTLKFKNGIKMSAKTVSSMKKLREMQSHAMFGGLFG